MGSTFLKPFSPLLCPILLVLPALFFTACSSSSYEGYKWRPYSIRGVQYFPLHPHEAVGFTEDGIASYYDESRFLFFPGKTALGEKQYSWSRGAAHKTLPLPARVRITNLENGKQAVVRVNDRGPFVPGRIIDVTPPIAKKLGFFKKGLARVRIETLSVGDGKYRIRKRAPRPYAFTPW